MGLSLDVDDSEESSSENNDDSLSSDEDVDHPPHGHDDCDHSHHDETDIELLSISEESRSSDGSDQNDTLGHDDEAWSDEENEIVQKMMNFLNEDEENTISEVLILNFMLKHGANKVNYSILLTNGSDFNATFGDVDQFESKESKKAACLSNNVETGH
jgi:hypothetical protein